MKLFELFEAQAKKKDLPAPRNPVARYAKRSGAGSHSPSKYTRKTKHKSKEDNE